MDKIDMSDEVRSMKYEWSTRTARAGGWTYDSKRPFIRAEARAGFFAKWCPDDMSNVSWQYAERKEKRGSTREGRDGRKSITIPITRLRLRENRFCRSWRSAG